MLNVIGAERAAILGQDYYYKDQSEAFKKDPTAVNFDHPDVIDFDLMLCFMLAIFFCVLVEDLLAFQGAEVVSLSVIF